jgi:outer membrane protein assembly factor BamD (BamD/ComL family)
MLRPIFPLLLATALAFGSTACEHKKTAAELQAERQKAFQTRQKGEAIRAYTALVTKFPESEFAAKAKERLDVLGPAPATPAPQKK